MSKDNLIERLWNPERATVPYQSLGDMCREAADAIIRKQALIEGQDKIIEDLGEQANRRRNEWGEAKALIEEMVEGLKKARSMLVSQMHAAGGFSLPESYYENHEGVRLIDVLITKATD